ncbi:MAG: hypothetical protein QOF47_2620 [Mycobacterium sp.]|nr:hypothetical protein [Mycobacterium sp.]
MGGRPTDMTDRRHSGDALNTELARWVAVEGRMATALVELENHPGHRLLCTIAATGRTAERWASARDILAGLWQDFGTYQAVVATARAVRDRRTRPGDRELTELHHLLVEPSIEVARTVVALPVRRLTGAAEHVETITLEELSARMDTAFEQVSEVVVTYDVLHQAFVTELAPLAERVLAARELAESLLPEGDDPARAAVTALTARIDELSLVCATDPLSLAGGPAADELATLATEVAAVSARLAGLAALREDWDNQLAELAATLHEIDTLRRQEEQARQRARELIADTGLAAPPDRLPALRSRLAAVAGPAGWPARATALAGLRNAVDDAAGEIRAAHERATGLQDRRAELCGRYEAYRAKAIRLGHAEHPEALALDDRIRQLLWTRPCDLAAATRALAAYQRIVQVAAGSRSA